MHTPDTMKLDLNLLRILDAVYHCGSTVKAAKKLGVSQSRVSQSLGRLRETLNDPLFNRVPGGLQPTARATAISQCMSRFLPEIYERCFDSETLEPDQYQGRVNIYISAILLDGLGPDILSKLTNLLPKAKIFLRQWSPETIEAFNSDDVNIGVNHFPLEIGKNIRQVPVVQEQPILIMRQGHPKARTDLSLTDLFSNRLAGTIIPGMSDHQSLVEGVRKDPNIDFAVRSESLPALFQSTLDSDLIMVGLALTNSRRPPGLVCFVPDCFAEIPLGPMSVAIYYRQGLAQDPRIIYLEEQLRTVIETASQAAIDSLDQPN